MIALNVSMGDKTYVEKIQSYEDVIARKSYSCQARGIEVAASDLPSELFPHQRDLVRWALRRGRSAIFADTGLGKSFCELAWAAEVAKQGRVLILTPLAVARQMVAEGKQWGVDATYMRSDDGVSPIVVANYEMMQHFDPGEFAGIVLDESSCLKSYDAKTRTRLIEAFKETSFRLAATATPAPNDFTELGNHSEFLGVKTRAEMLAEFFAHDGGSVQDWRIKGHAVKPFWKWLATWGAVIRSPSDLGHDDALYRLPPLRMHEHVIQVDDAAARASGFLFAMDAETLQEQRATRRGTLEKRVAKAAELAEGKDPIVIWGELNDECDAIERLIPGSVQVAGADSIEHKETAIADFVAGKTRVLVSKASIFGFGLNLQVCNRMIFLGASHSYEATYQAIRRCWRFGQKKPVDVHIIRANTERLVIENYRRKEADAARMAAEMAEQVIESVRAEVCGKSHREFNEYSPSVRLTVPKWIGMEDNDEGARPAS